MKTININELQAQISRVIRSVEAGETYEVMRYSRPVAVIVPKQKEKAGKSQCDLCQEKLDKIIGKLEK
jgi:prevent-host-death family protein